MIHRLFLQQEFCGLHSRMAMKPALHHSLMRGKRRDAGEIKIVGMLAKPCGEALAEGRIKPDFFLQQVAAFR